MKLIFLLVLLISSARAHDNLDTDKILSQTEADFKGQMTYAALSKAEELSKRLPSELREAAKDLIVAGFFHGAQFGKRFAVNQCVEALERLEEKMKGNENI